MILGLKVELEGWLSTVVPGATLNPVTLPLCPQIKLFLLDQTCPDGPYTPEETEKIIQETPYWCFCWASGQAIAQFLQVEAHWVRGKHVLDFGSGSGVAGIAARLAGAKRVVACDIDPRALQASLLNATLNNTKMEYEENLFDIQERYDVALVSDVLYDKENWPLLEEISLKADKVLVADSRVKTLPSTNYRVITRIDSTTLPDLNEFDEFKSVVIYSN